MATPSPEHRKTTDLLRRKGSLRLASATKAPETSSAGSSASEGLVDTTTLSTNWVVKTQQLINYDVISKEGLFDVDNRDLIAVGAPRPSTRLRKRPTKLRRFVVVDEVVDGLYGERIHEYFDAHHVETEIMPLDVSESAKTMQSVFAVVDGIDRFGISRRHEPIIAIGGGVLLDIVGVAASL